MTLDPAAPSTPLPLDGLGFLQHRNGDRIKDRYDVLEHLGGGAFGSVYRVQDTAVGNVLACKEMHVLNHPDTPHDERALALESFKREALTLATLRHPHIPAAYFEQEDGLWRVCPLCGFDWPQASFCPEHGAPLLEITARFYLMMDFVDGPTLEELAVQTLRQTGRPIDEETAFQWADEIAGALRTLHRVGIVHRDVKPENIKIRSSDGGAVLLDFGLTKKASEAGGYGTLRQSGTGRLGTPGYAPPSRHEQEHPDERSDIHALGMTLLRLLTGRDPQEPGDLDALRSHNARDFNATLSFEAADLLRKAVEPDASRRHAGIDDLLDDLRGLRAPSVVRGAPPFLFASGARARSGADLARLIEAHPSEAANYLFNGLLIEWLRSHALAAPASVAERAVQEHAEHPRRAVELLRRALHPPGALSALPRLAVEPPVLGFGPVPSGGKRSLTLRVRNAGPGHLWGRVLVQPAEAAPPPDDLSMNGAAANDAAALPGLSAPTEWEGHICDLTIALDTRQVPVGEYRGVLRLQTEVGEATVPVRYEVRALRLEAHPALLDFGRVTVGGRSSLRAWVKHLDTRSDGLPRGTLDATGPIGPLRGMKFPERFEGETPFEVAVEAGGPDAVARHYEGALHLYTNGGRLRVPVRYAIVLPAWRALQIIIGALLAGGLGAALLRLIYGLVEPEFAARWTTASPFEWMVRTPAPLLLGAGAGAWAAWKWQQSLAARLSRRGKADAMLTRSLPALGALAGVTGGWLLCLILQLFLWRLGDWLLWPLARFTSRHWAIPAWAVAGGSCGALWGVARVMGIKGIPGARYAVLGIYAFSFLALLLYTLLATAG